MSTLSVATIKSLTTAAPVFQNSSGTEKGQLAKFWVTFQGNSGGTNKTIDDDFNVSTVVDNGTGDFTINFTNSFSNDDYCVLGGHVSFSNGRNGFRVRPDGGITTNQTTSSVRIQCTQDGGMTDSLRIYVAGFGDS